MNIEEEIFEKAEVDFNKLLNYGFKEENNIYKYSKNIMNNSFKVDITITKSGTILGKIYDLSFGDEYVVFRNDENIGSFSKKVKNEYEKILKDIKLKCFKSKNFMYDQSNRITELIKKKYDDDPLFEWKKFTGYAVFKNKINKKWYGIIMNIDKSKLDKKLNGKIEIIVIKIDPKEIKKLLKQNGFYLAYHMNKNNWITIVLDDTITDNYIMTLIDKSYLFTLKNKY